MKLKATLIVLLILLTIIYVYDVDVDNKVPTLSNDTINDGPYIFKSQQQLKSIWLCKGQILTETLKLAHSSQTHKFNQCGMSSAPLLSLQNSPQPIEYKGDFNVAALSDFHGQYDLMITLLSNNKIIDAQGNWSFADGHFVITGDVFDRGDKVTEILWFLYELEQQALAQGGRVHLLLGNHEVMVLNGDLRYLHKKYNAVAEILNMPFQALYAENTILGDWLRSKSVLVKVNDLLFAHGGFHPSLAHQKLSLETINSTFKQSLIKAELAQPRDGLAKYLHKTNGPIWYRGYFKEDGASDSEIDTLLKHFNVNHIVVGHTSQKQIETRHQGKVIAIDSSIKNGEYGEILFVQQATMWRGSLTGEKLELF